MKLFWFPALFTVLNMFIEEVIFKHKNPRIRYFYAFLALVALELLFGRHPIENLRYDMELVYAYF